FHTPPPPAVVETSLYPDWLLAGWRRRDAWTADGSYRRTPRLHVQLERTLLEIERRWWLGADADRLRDELASRIDELDGRRSLFGVPPALGTNSLAQSVMEGEKTDPAVDAEITAAVRSRDELLTTTKPADFPKAEAKLVAATAVKLGAARPFAVTAAVVQAAAANPRPSPGFLRFTTELLPNVEQTAGYVEVLYLKRFAAAGPVAPEDQWPAAVVHRALNVVVLGEKVAARPESIDWVVDQLKPIAARRQEGLRMLLADGFAAADAADATLRQAEAAYRTLDDAQQAVDDANAALDEARVVLPTLLDLLLRDSRSEGLWGRAVDAEAQLWDVVRGTAPSADGLDRRLSRVRDATARLRTPLEALKGPFLSNGIDVRVAEFAEADLDQPLPRIDAYVNSAIPTADDRRRFWEAALRLAVRKHRRTADLDHDDDAASRATEPPTLLDDDVDRAARRQTAKAQVRLGMARGLLRMAGFAFADLPTAADAAKLDGRGWAALGDRLR
ncbi:MAG: hypothetical protein ACRDD1_02770, partial [Planctomycetia bacterium]